ncbi:PVC-type heme-binding CxxCH protein [Parapedobacter pyrenivorans]|uniref:PVC-type heme-binding CxxCH protein n=1 Tax=Parapedobacter pyrenivorans TaxID=1305674 RepID=UPI00334034B1
MQLQSYSGQQYPFGFVFVLLAIACCFFYACGSPSKTADSKQDSVSVLLKLVKDEGNETISVFRTDGDAPILVQHSKPDFRPYIHPIVAPDGEGVLTEYSPGHHKHQTGLYWGFTQVNGRDYFHNPQGDYWKRVAANIVEEEGDVVKWQTIYQLLDDKGTPVMEEIQNWSMQLVGGQYLLDLEWKGEALQDVLIGKYDYGGLFLRMPWQAGIEGEIVNAARSKNEQAEGQAAMWADVGMKIAGRDDWAHVAIFDHPENGGYPNKWRVDGQLGLGPSYTRDEDWSLSKGQTDVVRHRLVVYTGELNEMALNDAWSKFAGREGEYSMAELWSLAQAEGRNAKFLTPQEAVDEMTVKAGYEVNVWAAEPMMTQPMAFCWDDKGRLWVAENKDYESRGHGFSNAGTSRILILEDTDGDGAADNKKVFMEGLAFPAAIAVGFDGLYVGAPPNLLFVPDKDGDDKAEMEDVEILLTGWGIRDRHETLNSLQWGPDGWLYGLQGFATPSKIRKPNGDAKLYFHNDEFPEDLLEADGVDINGGVWRYHPVKHRFEVVAHGFSNPWGIDYDAKGQLFMTACVIPHLWHVVPGGIYHRQGGQHFNPYVYEDIKTIADHRHSSAHGGARIYQSDAFPKEEQGRIFMANIHEHAILSDILEPKGSGFVGVHGDDFMRANNAQWVGFSMEIGPDGGLYVLDWHDADICGQEVLNSETGRIFRVMPSKSLATDFPERYADLNDLTDEQLVALQTNASDWHARRARGILHKRATAGKLQAATHSQLKAIFEKNKNPDWRLRAMWALHITGGLAPEVLVESLEDKDQYIRGWAIQLLCEDRSPSPLALAKFRSMAQRDHSAVVRLYLAAALQRIDNDEKWAIAINLLQKKEDGNDHNLPKMIWYGIESLIAENPSRFLAMGGVSRLPMVTQYIARRAVDGDELQRLVALIGMQRGNTEDLLAGMLSGMEGRTDLKIPTNWKAVSAKLQRDNGNVKELATKISGLFGDREATQLAFELLKDRQMAVDKRQKALQTLAAQQQQQLITELPELLQEPAIRKDAIRAIAAFDSDLLGKLLIDKYQSFSSEERVETVQTLSSRTRYGNMLMAEIKAGRIPRKEVPANVARQLLRVVGSGFIEVWGPIETVASDKAAYEKYRGMLNSDALATADVKRGKTLFQQVCGSCHKMYGEGGVMGPDLTGSNRRNTDYILLNVLEPSAEIQDDYKMVVINTRDGRTYSGNVVGEDQRQLSLRIVGQEDPVLINKSTIQSKETASVSMMPPGLFEHLNERDVVDIMAYLKTDEQVK